MHLTLKKEATKPPAKNLLQQQEKFDRFIEYFNHERPHQALNGRVPSQLYRPSPRPYTGLGELEYPLHDRTITVTQCGRICIGRRKINLSQVFAGQNVGIKEIAEQIWLVSFMHYDLRFFDPETGRVECAQTRSVPICYPCLRKKMGTVRPVRTLDSEARPERFEPPTTWFEAHKGRKLGIFDCCK